MLNLMVKEKEFILFFPSQFLFFVCLFVTAASEILAREKWNKEKFYIEICVCLLMYIKAPFPFQYVYMPHLNVNFRASKFEIHTSKDLYRMGFLTHILCGSVCITKI